MKNRSENVKTIWHEGQVHAILLKSEFSRAGPNFFTPGEFSQQLGLLVHPRGKVIERHRHKLVKREILVTQEVLVLLEGRLKVELFTDDGVFLETLLLDSGDTILLARGGHRIEILEPSKIIEVKQGPYAGDDDKEYY